MTTTMRKRLRNFALVALAAATLPACTAGMRRPEVELENISVGSIGLSGGTLLANVRVDNPNQFDLRGQDLRYELFVRRPDAAPGDSAWVRFAEGTYDERLEIPARGSRSFAIPVAFSFRELGSVAGSILGSGRLDYRAVGTIDVRTPFGTREVPFRKTGTFMMSGVR